MTTPQSARQRASTATRRAADADWQQGVAAAQRGEWPAAAAHFQRALHALPQDRVYALNLAHALRHAGQPQRAVAVALDLLRLKPDDALLLRLLGDCQLQMHDPAAALATFEAFERAGHVDTDALLQHALALQALQRPHEAGAVLVRALGLNPALVSAHALLANTFHDRGRLLEAGECMRTVLALQPDHIEALAHLFLDQRHAFDWRDFDATLAQLRERLTTQPAGTARLVSAFGLLSLPLPGPLLLQAAAMEARAFAAGARPLPLAPRLAPQAGPVKLGLLSHDFREHPVSQLLVEVLEGLDRSRFSVHLYSIGASDGSVLRARVAASACHFVELAGRSDQQAAERIRDDGIELLVDLMGHTRGHRMGILARKPAPLQVAYLGFPGSTGLATIDYIVGDPLATPVEHAGHFSEHIAQLPLTLQPNGRNRPLPRALTRAEAGLPEDAFVLCAFNNSYKITPQVFDLWCTLLRQLPQALLWLRAGSADCQRNVLREAASRGVAPQRIAFAGHVPYAEHFSRLALADVFVDAWPYNAHTTAADALWAGVPVVTCWGPTYASRVAASVLNAAGMAELAFGDTDQYLLAVRALAAEPELRQFYRHYLNEQRLQLPLFDTPRYTRELEALFMRMVQRHRAGLPPTHLLADQFEQAQAQAVQLADVAAGLAAAAATAVAAVPASAL